MSAFEPPFAHAFYAMTTRCEVQLYGLPLGHARRIAKVIESRVKALETRYNFHAPTSWLNRVVNERQRDEVKLDPECARVLAIVREHAQRTQGAFDITVGTYKQALKGVTSLSEAQAVRERLQAYTGLSRWALSGHMLAFDNPHTRLDLGGVIKEYAVDVAAQEARRLGAPSGLINFGGDLYAFGCKPDGKRFVSAVLNPLDPARFLFALDLQDQALTTSAHYARHRTLSDGGRLSHVVNADASEQAWISATVVSGSALVSGIYSTSLLVRHDIDLPANAVAVVVDRQGQMHSLQATLTTSQEVCQAA